MQNLTRGLEAWVAKILKNKNKNLCLLCNLNIVQTKNQKNEVKTGFSNLVKLLHKCYVRT